MLTILLTFCHRNVFVPLETLLSVGKSQSVEKVNITKENVAARLKVHSGQCYESRVVVVSDSF